MPFSKANAFLKTLEEPKHWDLRRMRGMIHASGLDLSRLKAIQVGGTNGKGSVCAFLDSILRKQGFRVGFYSSPHLLDIRERIRVDGKPASRKTFSKLVEWVKPLVVRHKASAFEALTLMAFKHFSDRNVDFAVVEVGLGGRLDATNVLDAKVSVITNVEREHTDRLGKTVSAIASEKAGIIKPGQWAFVTASKGDALAAVRDKAAFCKVAFVKAGKLGRKALRGLRLKGDFQRENAGVALAVVRVLQSRDVRLSESAIRAGLRNASWPGRFQRFGRILVDGGHNPAGIRALVRSLGRTKAYTLVFGVLADKEYPVMVRTLCRSLKLRKVHLVRPDSPRALEPGRLSPLFEKEGVPVTIEKSVKAALAQFRGNGVVCGSLFVAAGALRALRYSGNLRKGLGRKSAGSH